MTWPTHRYETQAWNPQQRQGSKADRMLESIEVSIPPPIGDLNYSSSGSIAQSQEAAVIAVARLEAGFGDHLAPLADFLLRSESVASSKIERVDAGWRAFGRASVGGKASTDALSQLAAVKALIAMVDATGRGPMTLATLLDAHRLLMAPDFYAARDSGHLRDVQNWIGGSDYTPINALFVPPPPEQVPALMDDLMVFVNRTDVPIIAQAAIAHAQFESIHPFTDGNGRIGRALISAVLRRRGLTRRITVPLASVMLADTSRYFDRLTEYRAGRADEFVEYLASAAVHASEAAEESARALSELPARWKQLAAPRVNSADEAIIFRLLDTPILNADMAQQITGTTDASTYRALGRLTDAGVLELISTSKRNQIWAATDVLAELDALSNAIGRRTTSHL
ncbi:Fic family protein [Rhodococcus sp. PAMC28707]|uniref:Fic family protein n=1 Tax=unclassified Rhodococcus (in: high G+C Gram-positive bacteria) TaxID=192944 RepID=UPI00109E0AAF|nr:MULTISPECIES: Fic family protein [unclassified Rhodococcus (in: high G+C Gram-positive bacteria)]QCB52006.1 Fic family protein [Rhodococcus sp. PAMC28705]QCB59826.1 Fic family protein [Rhodococcus sp. PAMC28707]